MRYSYWFIVLLVVMYYYFVVYEAHEALETQKVEKLKQIIRPIIPPDEFDRIKVFDMKEKYGKDVAYTKNKKRIWICTKDKQGVPEEREALVFVLLHEYAHALNSSAFQHDKEFEKTFKDLLRQADMHGIRYKQKDRICGHCVNPNACSI